MGKKNAMEYMTIRNHIVGQIVSGDGLPRRLPSARKLAQTFGCTHPTVLRAIQDLVTEGWLSPCKRGGAITCDQTRNPQIHSKMFGFVVNYGKQDFDTHFFQKLYDTVASDLLARSYKYCVRNLYLESPSLLVTVTQESELSGLVLIAPHKQIVDNAVKLAAKGLPVACFHRRDSRLDSCDICVTENYFDVIRRLAEEDRRKLLVVGGDNYFYADNMKVAIANAQASCGVGDEILFLSGSEHENEQAVVKLLASGRKFDAVIFLHLQLNIYNMFCERFDVNKECRFVTNQFAVFRDMGFTGYVLEFDLRKAAGALNDRLLAQMTEKTPPVFIGIDARLIPYKQGVMCSMEDLR